MVFLVNSVKYFLPTLEANENRHVKTILNYTILLYILGRVKCNFFLFQSKTLRVESMNYCFQKPQPKFQPQIRSIIAHSIKSLK